MTQAIEEVYRRHAASLTRYATTLVGPDAAADVVAEAVAQTLRGDTLNHVDDIAGYWFRAITNVAASSHRSRLRREKRELKVASATSLTTSPETPSDARALLRALSGRQRAVVYLAYWHDMSPETIARTLDISEGTVRKQLARARQQLRKDLSR